ncbi:DUF4255 domain-containing protein [Derxia gummosa]|uniref:DUF4255 domain-containing protein n=1 Tax=Derxia gummosa DSM 723 TaxID=1121388 RepID=A0A8B6X395_9BURK|nr:DUF4255 domain-containing protein [Derxia gummosa]
MIAAALDHIALYLNQAMRRRFLIDEEFAVVAPLTDLDGQPAVNVANRLAVFLVNVEKDPAAYTLASASERHIRRPEPLHLNLRIMVAASYGATHYREALKMLSNAISLLQAQPVFDRGNTPEMDGRIEKLILDIESLSNNDLSNLWGVLGGRYHPSVLYRMRMVCYDRTAISAQLPIVGGTETAAAPHRS